MRVIAGFTKRRVGFTPPINVSAWRDVGWWDESYATFAVTNADGSTSVKTLAQLGITEINLRADVTHITLPDGSVITGQTTFTKGDGTTGTVANTSLICRRAGASRGAGGGCGWGGAIGENTNILNKNV